MEFKKNDFVTLYDHSRFGVAIKTGRVMSISDCKALALVNMVDGGGVSIWFHVEQMRIVPPPPPSMPPAIGKDTLHSSARILQNACHSAALTAGWWHDPLTGAEVATNPMHFSRCLMLIVSELGEAMEGDRKCLNDDKLPHRAMREVELADAVIRIFDTAGGYGMDLAGAIAEKLAYNAQRTDHKPENRAADGGKKY